jgi:mannose-6-phosphate isomerase-like protein (cupin superfamily)
MKTSNGYLSMLVHRARSVRTLALVFCGLSPLASQAPPRQTLVLAIECSSGDCALLQGAPETAGMRSGFVRLKPGESVGWHSTAQNEESLIILHGVGNALIEGQAARRFGAPRFLYIPPATRHNVENTGREVLEYIYVVAPAQGK